jgi:hypothetical protein
MNRLLASVLLVMTCGLTGCAMDGADDGSVAASASEIVIGSDHDPAASEPGPADLHGSCRNYGYYECPATGQDFDFYWPSSHGAEVSCVNACGGYCVRYDFQCDDRGGQ